MLRKSLALVAFVLGCVLVGKTSFAQNSLQLESINAAGFPSVELNVRTGSTRAPSIGDFEITENGNPVSLTAIAEAAGGGASGPTAVFILIEASGHTYGVPSANMKKAVTELIARSDIGTETPLNIGYFGRAGQSGTALNLLSAEFTTDHAAFVPMVNDRVVAPRDTTYRSDVFKSIYEALEYIANKPNLPARRMLLVVTAAINNSYSSISHTDCARLAKEKGIAVYGLGYATGNRYAADNLILLSEQTGGRFQRASSADDAQRGVRELVAQGIGASGGGQQSSGSYILKYTSAIEPGTQNVQVSVKLNGQRATGSYSAQVPEPAGGTQGGFIKQYGLYLIVGGVVLLLGLGALLVVNNNKKKKAAEAARAAAEAAQRQAQAQAQMDQVARMEAENRRLADEMRRKEQEAAAQLAAQQNQKLDLKRTMISPSAGGGTPVLSVQAPGFSNNFTLTKSRNQIGRAPGNDIQIPDQTVSSSHAVIWNESGQLYVEDIGSTNGSLLNGMRVQGKLAFKHGDLLQLGNATLKLV